MLSKSLLSVVALFLAGVSAGVAPVFTATREFNTLTDIAPYFVTATSTVTWTQSPSTSVVDPTGTGIGN
ncbi:hypothetical protein DFH07DRAFT_1055984 [Mycena maculata]|uniref:Uncharacterized protein n=1 Tax=Mycena maculata TaxID=230809 RepID=A0AAD7K6K1_9AGAR|nr:hypothetical protein DFH07DRAFT_1055984 [Mycena maculata]